MHPPGYRYEPIDTSSGYAPELLQAMNARRIAKVAQADKYAAQSFSSAENLYEYMVSWAVHEKKASKKLLQVANTVTAQLRGRPRSGDASTVPLKPGRLSVSLQTLENRRRHFRLNI